MNVFLTYILYFFFYSAVGWLVESVYCSIAARKWINRGFLTGPICPIYGTGAVVFAVCLGPLKDTAVIVSVAGKEFSITPVLVFVAGMILADIVEFITSVIMEKLFRARWWDYSDKPFNIQGRICLMHTLYWGVACIVFLYLVHPFVQKAAAELPQKAVYAALTVILIAFTLDLANAVRTAMDVRKVMDKVRKISDSVTKFANDIKNNVEVRYDEIQSSAAKRMERFTQWRSDLTKQVSELFESAGISFAGKRNEYKGKNRLFEKYPNLVKTAKKQMDSLEDFLLEIKNKFTDSDDEMY